MHNRIRVPWLAQACRYVSMPSCANVFVCLRVGVWHGPATQQVDVAEMLLARRRAAQQLPRTDPSYGMMRGQDESDEILVGWTVNTTELPHVSFSLEAWRGQWIIHCSSKWLASNIWIRDVFCYFYRVPASLVLGAEHVLNPARRSLNAN